MGENVGIIIIVRWEINKRKIIKKEKKILKISGWCGRWWYGYNHNNWNCQKLITWH